MTQRGNITADFFFIAHGYAPLGIKGNKCVSKNKEKRDADYPMDMTNPPDQHTIQQSGTFASAAIGAWRVARCWATVPAPCRTCPNRVSRCVRFQCTACWSGRVAEPISFPTVTPSEKFFPCPPAPLPSPLHLSPPPQMCWRTPPAASGTSNQRSIRSYNYKYLGYFKGGAECVCAVCVCVLDVAFNTDAFLKKRETIACCDHTWAQGSALTVAAG